MTSDESKDDVVVVGEVKANKWDSKDKCKTGQDAPRRKWFRNPLKKHVPPVPTEHETSPEQKANIFTRVAFDWMAGVLSVGYRRPLTDLDIPLLNEQRRVEAFNTKIMRLFRKRAARGDKHALLLSLNRVYFKQFWGAGALQLVAFVVQALSPLLLKEIVLYGQEGYEGRPAPIGRGVGLVIALIIMLLASTFMINHGFYRGLTTGGMTRASLISLIYSKSLVISARAKAGGDSLGTKEQQGKEKPKKGKDRGVKHDAEGWSNGKVMNLMSTDTAHIDNSLMWIHMIWLVPVQLVVIVIQLIVNLGVSALPGLALFLLMTPVLSVCVKKLAGRREKLNQITDKRLGLTQEILQSVRFVKFFTWEDSFIEELKALRRQEIRGVKFLLGIRSGLNGVAVATPVFAAMLSFITYSLLHTHLQAADVFSSLSLFFSLRVPLSMMPMVSAQAIDAYISIGRIQDYLLAEEDEANREVDINHDYAFTLQDASFTWESPATKAKVEEEISESPDEAGGRQETIDPEKGLVSDSVTASKLNETFNFDKLNLQVSREELIAVVGSVGSGKTSLLAALAGEMRNIGGTVAQGAAMAYCPQYAWIQNATVKDNITFGRPLDQRWYDSVVDGCALRADFDMLPAGDMTHVGERGITLSGGQKQRLNIARAIYSNAPIVLLDDPLSAVDAHVGRHIFSEAICGLMRGKCRVLATHQLHVLDRCDRIMFMKNGKIDTIGTYQELKASNPEFRQMLAMSATDDEEQTEEADAEPQIHDQGLPADRETELPIEKVESKIVDAGEEAEKGELMQKEEKGEKGTDWRVWRAYLEASGGLWMAPLVFSLISIAQVCNIVSTVWLGYWTSDSLSVGNGIYIAVYAVLAALQAIAMFGFAIALTIGGATASKRLLQQAMTRILSAPMSFFDTTPLGRIVNRFSKDVDVLDNFLSESIRMYLFTVVQIFSIFILIFVYFPEFIAAFVPLCLVYYLVAAYYRASAREIQRCESVLRSVVFSRFSESLTGTSTIRAYGVGPLHQRRIDDAINSMDAAYFLKFSAQAWLSIRLDVIGILLAFVAGMLVVTSRFGLKPSVAGLVLTYMLQVIGMVQWMIKLLADVENSMNSTERLHEYGHDIPCESDVVSTESAVSPEWPDRGDIHFRSVQMRYREGLPLALKGLDLDVKAGERIGVVGRTGSGKSSIMACLFRLVELCDGSIEIDGVDISKVKIRRLRKSLSIIPQDPTLFRGTVRSNLDPFNEHTDLELWHVLQQAYLVPMTKDKTSIDDNTTTKDLRSNHVDDDDDDNSSDSQTIAPSPSPSPYPPLTKTIPSTSSSSSSSLNLAQTPLTLSTPVSEEGLNFSLGQRQLLALSRALVRSSRIIICDEATSSIDEETDRKIQETMAHGFRGRTVLCIAHRLQTIINYDRVVVIDAGRIVEVGEPFELWRKEGTVFRGMCDHAKIRREGFGK